jgi:membrane-associated PAP2 superfamily phosphatase
MTIPVRHSPEPARGRLFRVCSDTRAARGAARLAGIALVPVVLVAAAAALRGTGLDERLTAAFFDVATGTFPLRRDAVLELYGHDLAKSAVLLVWFGLLAASVASAWLADVRPYRRWLWSTTLAMALGPMLVVLLKDLTTLPCPWSLQRFGGYTVEPREWFAVSSQAGHCFPSGHSAGGFSLVAFPFAAAAAGHRRLAGWLLAGVVAVWAVFSAVRLVQGAHFLSHALWAAAIDWLAAGLVFALLAPSGGSAGPRVTLTPAGGGPRHNRGAS